MWAGVRLLNKSKDPDFRLQRGLTPGATVKATGHVLEGPCLELKIDTLFQGERLVEVAVGSIGLHIQKCLAAGFSDLVYNEIYAAFTSSTLGAVPTEDVHQQLGWG